MSTCRLQGQRAEGEMGEEEGRGGEPELPGKRATVEVGRQAMELGGALVPNA